MIPQSFDEEVIKEIAGSYHYEDMDFAGGDPHKAIQLFEENLSRLREVADVKTICMHGSPLSKYDNRDLSRVLGTTTTAITASSPNPTSTSISAKYCI